MHKRLRDKPSKDGLIRLSSFPLAILNSRPLLNYLKVSRSLDRRVRLGEVNKEPVACLAASATASSPTPSFSSSSDLKNPPNPLPSKAETLKSSTWLAFFLRLHKKQRILRR